MPHDSSCPTGARWSTAARIERYRLVAICAASRLTRYVRVKHRYIAQELPAAYEHFADLGQQLLSAITVGIRVGGETARGPRSASRSATGGYRRTVRQSQCILDLAHRGIVGSQRARRYPRGVHVADDRDIGQGVGAVRYGQAAPQVVLPSGMTNG